MLGAEALGGGLERVLGGEDVGGDGSFVELLVSAAEGVLVAASLFVESGDLVIDIALNLHM